MLNAITDAELVLAPEYKYVNRSMGGVPSATYNKVMMEHFPQDWELTKSWYPLAEVKNVREEMIDANYPLWMEQEARKRGGRTEELPKVGEEESGERGGGDGEGAGMVIPNDEAVESGEE